MIVEKRGYIKTYDDEGKLISKVRVGSPVPAVEEELDDEELDLSYAEYGDESA